MKKKIICPRCGEKENFHFNHDYSKKGSPIENILCNECGKIFFPFKNKKGKK